MAAAPSSISTSVSMSLESFAFDVPVAIVGAAGVDELRFPEPPAPGEICTVALWSYRNLGRCKQRYALLLAAATMSILVAIEMLDTSQSSGVLDRRKLFGNNMSDICI